MVVSEKPEYLYLAHTSNQWNWWYTYYADGMMNLNSTFQSLLWLWNAAVSCNVFWRCWPGLFEGMLVFWLAGFMDFSSQRRGTFFGEQSAGVDAAWWYCSQAVKHETKDKTAKGLGLRWELNQHLSTMESCVRLQVWGRRGTSQEVRLAPSVMSQKPRMFP